jgi:hypothetical protein
MKVTSKGKEIVIKKETDQEVTQDLVVYNLLKLFDIIQPWYRGNTVKQVPAFFDSL